MQALLRDPGHAGSMLRKNLKVTAVIVPSLAIGIGANSAISGVVDAAAFAPLSAHGRRIDRPALGCWYPLPLGDDHTVEVRRHAGESAECPCEMALIAESAVQRNLRNLHPRK